MVVPRDLRPILYTARFLGCGYHLVTEDDIRITKSGTVYSVFWIILYLVTFVGSICILVYDRQMESKLMILTSIRTLLCYICLFVDLVLSIVWNRKIRGALVQMRNFDRATRFSSSQRSRITWTVCLVLVILVLLFWSVVGYMSYRYEQCDSILNGFLYGLVNAVISVQILSFLCISFLLRERFRRLNQMVLFSEEKGKIMVVDFAHKQFRLQEVWWLHNCLANATEAINSVYATQLLLWIACMSFNTLSRIYTLNETIRMPNTLKARECLLVTACASNLLLITAICHTTASQANSVGKTIFSPLSFTVGQRNFTQDNVEAAAYFQLRTVHFFAAAGLIRIDLPLLLSIASGITTYLVILHAPGGI